MRNCVKGESGDTQGESRTPPRSARPSRPPTRPLFEETYGDDDPYTPTANAYGKCVSSKVRAEDDEDTEAFENAAKECKAERAADPRPSRPRTASAKSKGKNALGKCVSQTVKATPGRLNGLRRT